MEGGSYWIVEKTRAYYRTNDFLKISKDFDRKIAITDPNLEYSTFEDYLLVTEAAGKTGPQLTIPNATLTVNSSITIELWVAYEQIVPQSTTILGVSGKAWNKGFALAGTMNSTAVSYACVFDTLSPELYPKSACGIATPVCRGATVTQRGWRHIACSRTGNTTARIMIDDAGATYYTGFNTSIPNLFAPGNLVLGAKDTGSVKTAGFTGYLRELRMWNRWLSNDEIISMMNMYNFLLNF